MKMRKARMNTMPTRTKYIYSVFDIKRKTHIAHFSSLDRAKEFVLSHELKVYTAWDNHYRGTAPSIRNKYSRKQNAAFEFNPTNKYYEREGYTHLYIKIPLDESGNLHV